MILKGSQRGGAGNLSAHLLNKRDNDHVRVLNLRGFMADDLTGALQEAYAISRATKCRQFMFSLSLNPPKNALVKETDFQKAADAAEKRLGLSGQPRAIILHEKEGRRHAHVVWSRIRADELKAVELPFFKNKLKDLSRDLFLEHQWTLPEGLRTHGGRSPLNFSLAEWQQAKRLGRDPREIKDAIRDCWNRSDDAKSLAHALDERGYFLAQGDRRSFVIMDTDGEVYSLARYAGVKTKDVRAKLGDPDKLPSLTDITITLQRQTTSQARNFILSMRQRHVADIAQAKAPLAKLKREHEAERGDLAAAQSSRWEHETRDRAARFRKGLAGLWDTITGRKRALRQQNEREAADGLRRDSTERDRLVETQLEQRRPFQFDLDRTRKRHAEERQLLARELAAHRKRLRSAERQQSQDSERPRERTRRRGTPSLDL
ncbi:relaxase/mobilization nuclease domain-containing protein [Sphingomonas colocasiae]|uniref:Relaxase/mobilization nuclease domain-containing protein n=1 Tax=Sphingomonas colocasiae TaxID=1848973 RepID=A0ABS7PSF5_9SPHN|nr:relaxase/mobilization nuclease domain-containing protein [Sphingomonas colocasiae]MBY8824276.1 relaxase/mobilization nuclease domain-containing protein [Sphingomonas colocasiae]